jgi:hypothetical protein
MVDICLLDQVDLDKDICRHQEPVTRTNIQVSQWAVDLVNVLLVVEEVVQDTKDLKDLEVAQEVVLWEEELWLELDL